MQVATVPPRRSRVDGILLLDKPAGPSSNQALQHAKRLLGALKAGHAGTLDPLATGLLPVVFGEATKFVSYLSQATKVYEATLLLGVITASGDVTGIVTERRAVYVESRQVLDMLARFVGAIQQVPPMHSAIKHHGTPLYRLARRGEEVVRPPRDVFIDELVATRIEGDEVDIRVRCSKGTYIRVLAEDVGKALGCGATLKRLRRTEVGPFVSGNSISFDDLEKLDVADRLRTLLPVDAGLEDVPACVVSPQDGALIRQGRSVRLVTDSQPSGPRRIYEAPRGVFLGMGRLSDCVLQPIRLVSLPASEMS